MRLKNEVTVGLMVVAGMIILVVAAFWMSGKPWGEQQLELMAITEGAGELREGNPVKYRGVQVGRVTNIGIAPGGQGVLVSMEILPDLEMPPQPALVLSPASLFGDWQASIISMPQQPDLEFITTTTPGILPGATLPDITELTAVGARIAEDLETLANRVDLAFTEETAIKIRETVDNIQEASEQFSGFMDQQTATYQDVSESVLATTRNMEQATSTVQQVALDVGEQVPLMVANASAAADNLRQLSVALQSASAGVPALVARADTTLATMDEVIGNVSGLMEQLQPAIEEVGPTLAEARAAMSSLQGILARVERGEGTLGRLAEDPALYEEMQAAIATLRRVMADLQANPGRYIGEVRIF